MPTWTQNRWLSIAVAVGYALTITTASLFHDHGDCDGERCCHEHLLADAACTPCHHGHSESDAPHPNAPKTPVKSSSDASHCSVCQFLGHKPAPTAEVTVVALGMFVQDVPSPAPARIASRLFSAWQSRAPPCFA
jgi:hypothetical protein